MDILNSLDIKKLVNNLIRKIDLNYKLQISDIKTEEELQTYIDKNNRNKL